MGLCRKENSLNEESHVPDSGCESSVSGRGGEETQLFVPCER